jgi:predicted RNase H-like HicB family nuclease
MMRRFVLTDYVERAMALAIYDKLEDGTFAGRIPVCRGIIAFGSSLRECEDELRSTLEDWILVGLKLGHPLPVISKIDLNHQALKEFVASRKRHNLLNLKGKILFADGYDYKTLRGPMILVDTSV